MNTHNIFGRSARRSAIVMAIAFAAAVPAMAGPAVQGYAAAGYPVGEAMDFELPSMRSADVATSVVPKAAVAASVSGADANQSRGEAAASSGEHVAMVEVPQLPMRQQVPITRDSVRAELIAARRSGTLTQANEAGDSQQVLAAREAFNDDQATAIVAEYQAEYARQMALREQEIMRTAALNAEWRDRGLARAPVPADNAMAEVQIDVISIQPQAVGE